MLTSSYKQTWKSQTFRWNLTQTEDSGFQLQIAVQLGKKWYKNVEEWVMWTLEFQSNLVCTVRTLGNAHITKYPSNMPHCTWSTKVNIHTLWINYVSQIISMARELFLREMVSWPLLSTHCVHALQRFLFMYMESACDIPSIYDDSFCWFVWL